MNKFLIKLMTCWIVGSKCRKFVRRRLQSYFFSKELQHKAVRIGEALDCLGPVKVYGPKIYLSDHVNFNGATFLGRGNVRIGRYFHSGYGLTIMTESHNYEGSEIPYDNTFIVKDVEIGDFVWLGINVILLPGTKIGKGAIIQAGSVVHGEIPPYAIAGGNPARVFSRRNSSHFDEMFVAEKFH